MEMFAPAAIFHNFEVVKLHIADPETINLITFSLLIITSCFTLRKTTGSSILLSRDQTDSLKGIAILFVIIGHFWVHVSEASSSLVLGRDAVALFFLLSGYGLTVSVKNRYPGFIIFFQRRVNRVMIPYWSITILIVCMDYLLLRRTYSLGNLILTFLGINITITTRNIDYVRWYITLLLVWYGVFYIAISKIKMQLRLPFLFVCATIIYFLDYYILHFGWYQVYAFPIGCACGYYYDTLNTLFSKYSRLISTAAALILCSCIVCKFLLIPAKAYLPSLIFKTISEFNAICISAALIVFVALLSLKGYHCSFLIFCGRKSFELFLIHGAFLIRYNPIIMHTNTLLLTAELVLFITFVLLLSTILQQIIPADS